MNISSAVVKVAPKYLNQVLNLLEESQLCEVHFYDDQGKIIITVEANNVSEEMEKFDRISKLDHVLSVDLVYCYSEEELADAIDEFHRLEDKYVPDALKDA
ncbi:MAG: chaperone NapD [Aquificae bacterium]|nr:chaperone NapD [Aquificota bacterium]